MRNAIGLACVLALTVAACGGSKSAYEAAVEDFEPAYCYQSLGGVTCHNQPYARDSGRLINFYGPAPARYPVPERAEPARPGPPPPGGFVVRDPEPVPHPMPHGSLTDRPWLTDGPTRPDDGVERPPEAGDSIETATPLPLEPPPADD